MQKKRTNSRHTQNQHQKNKQTLADTNRIDAKEEDKFEEI